MAGALAYSAATPRFGGAMQWLADRQATEFAIFGIEEQHPSKILRDRSEPGMRLGELYDTMLSYPMLAGLWEKRWKALLGLPWAILPADNSPRAQEIADAAQRMLDAIPGLDINLRHQLEGVPKGLSVDEMRWEKRDGLWQVTQIEDRPMWRFGFKSGELHVRRIDGLLTPAPAGRFLCHRHGTKDEPWGKPLLDAVYWYYWLALHGWKYYGVAVEKWAQPTVIVRYPRNNGTDEAAVSANQEFVSQALSAAAGIATESAMAMPEGLVAELLEATRGGSVSYDQFLGMLDRTFALVLLGEVDTSGLGKAAGSYAKSRVSNDVRLETIRMDARALADNLTDQLLAVFTRVNYGIDAPVPYWEFDVEEAEDRKLRSEGCDRVLEAGEPVPRAHLYRVNQVPMPAEGDPVVRRKRATAPQPFTAQPPSGDEEAPWDEQELVN